MSPCWCGPEFAGLFLRTREAYAEHERAKTELKTLVPEDARGPPRPRAFQWRDHGRTLQLPETQFGVPAFPKIDRLQQLSSRSGMSAQRRDTTATCHRGAGSHVACLLPNGHLGRNPLPPSTLAHLSPRFGNEVA